MESSSITTLPHAKSRLVKHGSYVMTATVHLDRFASEAGRSLRSGTRMLDAGAGDSPYRQHFQHVVYEAADSCTRPQHKYEYVHYKCNLTSIPVESERYDLVLCTQVLEHVPHPLILLRELHRVLKPDGKLWISAPLMFEEHEVPYDFYRYTQYGWKFMMHDAGFNIERIEWVQGYFGTLAYQFNNARRWLPWRPADYGGGVRGLFGATITLFARPALLLLAWMFTNLDLRHKYTKSGHCLDYCVVASKQSPKDIS